LVGIGSRRLLLAGCLVLAVALGTAACGRSSEPSSTDSTAPDPVVPGDGDTAPRPPDLGALALDVDDLPPGTGIDFEEFVGAVGATSGFRRNFAVQGRKLGASEPVELQTDLLLFPDETAAEAVILEIRESLAVDDAAEPFRRALQNSLDLEVENLVGATRVFPDLGDGTVAAEASFDTRAGRADGLLVISRVSVFVNIVLIIAPEGQLDGDDLGPPVERAVARLEAEAERLRDEGWLPERETLPRRDEGDV
jgi:hypothetical protein